MKKLKKTLSLFIAIVLSLSINVTAFANESNNSTTTEQLPVFVALSNPEIVNFLNETGEFDELAAIQTTLKNSLYESAANNTNHSLNISSVSVDDIQKLSNKYDLSLPFENEMGMIDNGSINVTRNTLGDIIDVWYLYYPYNDSSFSVCAALIDNDNPLDSVKGTVTRYCLNNTTWEKEDDKSFSKTGVKNGEILHWSVDKWGVKEKFEYNITVVDNGKTNNFDNANENNMTRYNFEAKPYNSFSANGGHRHHFIPATSLKEASFNSNTAYAIRMMTADHKLTGSYGSSSYVKDVTNLLRNKQYYEALQHEVDDLQSHLDSEGLAGTLQQKYYNEVVICLFQYESLFGIN